MGPGPPKIDLVHPVPKVREAVTGDTNWGNLLKLIATHLYEVGATWCISTENLWNE